MATIYCMECVLTIQYIVCAKNVDYNVCLRPTQLIRCLGGTAFVGQIAANRGKLRNFYYGFTTFEESKSGTRDGYGVIALSYGYTRIESREG